MPDLSICLVNHNSKRMTMDCIGSIYAKTASISFEIILVDNNSTDDSQEAVRVKYPQVKIINNSQNRGFAAANNQAIELASGRYLILLNNDTVLKNAALDKMTKFMDSDRQIGALTCKLFNADGKTIQRNCRAFPSTLDSMFGRASLMTRLLPDNPRSKRNLLSDWDYNSIREIDWSSGASLMVRSEAVDKIGLLDEKFFMFWEDTDWCKRIKDAGYKIFFLPEAEIIHFTGKGGGKRSLWLKLYTMYQMHRSAYYYFRKHYYRNAWHPMAILLLFGMILLTTFKGCYEIMRYPMNSYKERIK